MSLPDFVLPVIGIDQIEFVQSPDLEILKRVPALDEMVQCPNCKFWCSYGDYWHSSLRKLIIHLNDQCLWTREAIADWLDTLDLDLSFSPLTQDERDQQLMESS